MFHLLSTPDDFIFMPWNLSGGHRQMVLAANARGGAVCGAKLTQNAAFKPQALSGPE